MASRGYNDFPSAGPQGIQFGDESHSEGIPKGPEMGPEMDRVGSSAVRMVIYAQKKMR